jgi:hypothetical protein
MSSTGAISTVTLGTRILVPTRSCPGAYKEKGEETPQKIFPDQTLPDSRAIGSARLFAVQTSRFYRGSTSEGNRYIHNDDL